MNCPAIKFGIDIVMAYRFSKSDVNDTSTIRKNRWRDIDLSFERNLITNDVKVLTDENAVKQAVKNLILTEFYERPFNPSLGCGTRKLLFEPLTPILTVRVKKAIENTLKNYEPRIRVVNIFVVGNPDRNELDITIEFNIRDFVTTTSVNFSLKRTR